MILVFCVANPFEPTKRTEHPVEYIDGMTLADVMEAAGLEQRRHTCVIEGLAVPEEMLAGFPATDGSAVVVMPAVGGGGWGRMAAEMAVMVAAAAVTYGVSLTAFGTTFAWTGLAVSGTTANLVAAGIALGGNMLVNAFMGGVGGGGPDSASWDPTGPKTVASGGTPIPKGYGTVMSGGQIIASYVSAEGKNNYLNVLTSHGFGPALGISDLRINGNSVQNFQGVTYQVRYGTNTQTPISNFNMLVNGYPQALRVSAPAGGGTPVVVNGTGTATQGLQIVVQFPNGVYWQEDSGGLRSLAIAYKVEYSVHGSGVWNVPVIPRTKADIITRDIGGHITYHPSWVVVPNDAGYSAGVVYAHDDGAHTPGDAWSGTQTVTYYNADGSSYTGTIALSGEWQPCDPNLNQQSVTDWSGGYVIFTDANQGALYHTTEIYNLPPARYDVRITKYGSAFSGDPIQPREANNNRTGDQVWIHSINEVQYQDLAYPNMILIGVRALATNQLSGASLNITASITYGISAALPAELAAFGTDNPAVVAYDMLTSGLYGGGVAPELVDAGAFAVWASYCDELVADGFGGTVKRARFNGIFDQQNTNLWKSLQKVAMCGYASIIQIGRTYTVVVDQPAYAPLQVFTAGNIARDSIKDTWVALDDRANRIEVTFPDAARDYRTDEPCAVMLAEDIQAGVAVKTTRVSLLGCTSRAQAWHWAYRKLKQNNLLLLTRSFDVNIEAVACQVGSVIGVQDDVTAYAYGGRIQAGSSAGSLLVDRDDLPFTAGEGWTVSVVHPVVHRGSGTIQSIAGKVVQFAVNIPSTRVLSLTNPSGTNYVIEGTGVSSATVQSAVGLSVGQGVDFWDQDVVDTRPISALSGATLTPASAFLQDPSADCPWVYGQSAGAFPAKLFTVTGIRRKGDFQVTLDTIIYDPAVETIDTPIITETLGVPDSQAAVTNLTAAEQYLAAAGANGGRSSVIALGWRNGANTAATQIWVARNDPNQPLSSEVLQATVPGTTFTLAAPTGTILEIRAVGVDAQGLTAPFSTAPVVTITVQGSGLAPGNVTDFSGVTTPGATAFTWSAVSGAANYEIRYNADIQGTDWQAATLLWSGDATSWTDPQNRLGCYLIKALSADSVESVSPTSWNYLLSPVRLNSVGLSPGQSVQLALTQNTYDAGSGTASLQVSCPAQALFRADGTTVTIPASSVQWVSELAGGTSYYLYLYLQPNTFMLAASTGASGIPDTAPNAASLAYCSANGNYPAGQIQVVTAGSSGAGSLTGPSRPSNYSDQSSPGFPCANPSFPYSDSATTNSSVPAAIVVGGNSWGSGFAGAVVYSGFPSITTSAPSTLNIPYWTSVSGNPGAYTISFSLDGGNTWSTLLADTTPAGSSGSPVTLTHAIPVGQDLTLVQVKAAVAPPPASGSSIDMTRINMAYPLYIE